MPPEIGPGAAAVVITFTASDAAEDTPQALFAVTDIVPLTVPVVAEIEGVDDVPVHPVGSVQV